MQRADKNIQLGSLPSSMASRLRICDLASAAAWIVLDWLFSLRFRPITTGPWYDAAMEMNLGPNVRDAGASAGLATVYWTGVDSVGSYVARSLKRRSAAGRGDLGSWILTESCLQCASEASFQTGP